MGRKPRIFIASSKENINIAEAVNVNLDHDAEVTLWRNGFELSATYLESLTLLDLDDLVAHITNRYEQLDTTTRSLVPLVRVYWPAG